MFPELEQPCLQHFWNYAVCLYHGRIKYKDTCLLSFKIDLFCGMCLTYFIDWRYIHSWLVFSTQLVNCCLHGTILVYSCPSTFSLTSPLPPLSKVNVQYIQTMCGCWGGGGGLSCVVYHILQEFNTLFMTRFRNYKIATPPQSKMTSKDDI